MKINYAARVEMGTRETNDDRALIDGRILDMMSQKGELSLPTVAAICDGCGGYDGGGVAAQTVLEVLSAETPESLGNIDHLKHVLGNCEQAIFDKKKKMPHFSKMCTTIAGCVFLDDSIVFFHSGDSRIYRCDRWGLSKMTVDHSAVQQMIDMGQMTEEEAAINPNRNVITRCIGIACQPPEIYVSKRAIAPGDKFLICSDGLWENVSAEQMEEILSRDVSLDKMADFLIETALNQGGDDNISVCICAVYGNITCIENESFALE